MTLTQLKSARDYKLTLPTLTALLALRTPRSATLTTLAKDVGISPAGMTRVADKLEVLGYANRRFGADRRTVWFDINESGIAVLDDLERGAA